MTTLITAAKETIVKVRSVDWSKQRGDNDPNIDKSSKKN